MQDLVGVDVADAGDDVLIEQERLEDGAPTGEEPTQRGDVQSVGQWINSEVGQLGELDVDVVGIEDDDLTERARVDEPQRFGRLAVERHDHMGVRWTLRFRRGEQQLPGHAQVDHQRVTGVEGHEQVLAAPLRRQHLRARETVDDLLGRRATDAAQPTDLDTRDRSPDDVRRKAAPDGLDLGQLRHQLVNARQAASAADCSAAFFERPAPSPSAAPFTTTVAKKCFA